jgi:hypothetical protein
MRVFVAGEVARTNRPATGTITARVRMNVLSRFRVVLLDMNSTLMFGEDRFGDAEDFLRRIGRLGARGVERGEGLMTNV